MAAWNAHVSKDGVDGTRNSVGDRCAPKARPTRATAAGEVRVPTRGMDPCDPRARDMEHVRRAEGLQDKSRGQLLFGHLERSNLLRNGDKPGNFFSEVSEYVCPVKRKENPPARQRRPSWPSWLRSTQCEPCQAATVWRGK
jgi:hypothetical protein